MQRYGIVHPLYLSFFSKPLYRDVARNWKGLCLTYLLALLALSVIPGVMKVQGDLTDFINTKAPGFVKQFPTLTISDGKVSTDKPQPFYIKDEKTGKPAIIIDTTGRITSLKGSPASALVTKTAVIIKTGKDNYKTFDLSDIKRLVVNRRVIYSWLDSFQNWSPLIFYPMALIVSLIYHIIGVVFYAAIGLMFARTLQVRLPFRALIRLAVIAITPSVVLGTFLDITGTTIPYWWYFSLLISTAYVYFAVRANSGKEPQPAASDA